jgi:hypothetical protein
MASVPALAANGNGNNAEQGGGGEPCTENCPQAQVDWNPELVCTEPIQGISGLVDCLFVNGGCDSPSQAQTGGDPNNQVLEGTQEDCIILHPTGEYLVEPLGENGFKIRFAHTFEEIERIRFSENYPVISKISLEVDGPVLQAEIAEIQGTPTEGVITLTLNGRAVVVNTVRCPDDDCVTWELLSAIRQEDFGAGIQSDGAGNLYIVVDWDSLLHRGLFSVALESTDDGIVASEIALEPWGSVPGGPGGHR